MRLGDGAEPREAGRVEATMWNVRLVPAEDRLWIVTGDAVGFLKDGKVTMEPARRVDTQSAFLLDGAPAVLDVGQGSYTLLKWDGSNWKTQKTLPWKTASRWSEDLRVVVCDGRPHTFRHEGGLIFHAPGLPEGPWADPTAWTKVGPVPWRWSAFDAGGRPVVATIDLREPMGIVRAFRLGTERWEPAFEHRAMFMTEAGVVATGPDRFEILSQDFPGSIKRVRVEGGRVESAGGALPSFMITTTVLGTLLNLCIPLGLAAALSSLMARHRVARHASGAEYATLWRRAVAHALDGVVAWGPGVAAPFIALDRLDWSDLPRAIVTLLAVGCGSMVWFLLVVVVFSWMEGSSGRTPGKWLLGIRVVRPDGTPCGFVRGLGRNLLRIVDSFLQYGVGLLAAAFTPQWQRLGDLAADTIVIKDHPSPSPPNPNP